MSNKQPQLSTKARRFAMIIQLLFARQDLAGKLDTANRGARHLSLSIRLNDPTKLDKALKLAEPLALATGVNAVLAQRVAGVVAYQFELPGAYWEYYTRQDVTGLALGLAEQRRPVMFGFDPAHALIAGTTGSGKSETIKSALVALVTSYKPEQLGVIVIDPHADYTDLANEAHQLCPIATSQEDIKQALGFAYRELVHRKANNIKDGQTWVIIIDEADKPIALGDKQNLAAAQSISQEGRKYKLFLVVGTQKPTHSDLPNVLDNLANRFVGLVTDAQLSARLTGQAGLDCHKLTGKGDFIHVSGATVERFQVAMATRSDFDRLERKEVAPVASLPADFTLPIDLPERKPGRPQLQLNPEYAAWYFFHHPDKISRAMAKELGLTRDNHELHQGFVREFIKAYLKLRRGQLHG